MDDATGDELAEMGMSLLPKAVVCFECRFQGATKTWQQNKKGPLWQAIECLAFHKPCNEVNKQADCKFFEPRKRNVSLTQPESKALARGLAFGLWMSVVAIALSLTSIIIVLARCA